MPYYILNWKGSNNGSRRFFAQEDDSARQVASQLMKEFEQTLDSYHEFVLEKTQIVHLGEKAYIHKPKRTWKDLLKDLMIVGPKLICRRLCKKPL